MMLPLIPARRIVIVGAGKVGAAAARRIAQMGLAAELILLDIDEARASAEALDLGHALAGNVGDVRPGGVPCRVRAGMWEEAVGAEIVVLTAGVRRPIGGSRLDTLRDNAALCDHILPRVREHAPHALLVIATNPVDVLTWYAVRRHGWDPARVIGTGTLLDTNRLRHNLWSYLGMERVARAAVRALVIGEHGDSLVPVYSLCGVGALGMAEVCAMEGLAWDAAVRAELTTRTRESAAQIVQGKGHTAWGIAEAIAQIVELLVNPMRDVYPVSTVLDGPYGLHEVALSLPVTFNREGVLSVMEYTLADAELAALQRSAAILRRAQSQLDR